MPGSCPPTLEPVLWSSPGLPPDLDALLAEACATGFGWIAPLPAEWAARPFTEEGEGLFVVPDGAGVGAVAAISADPCTDVPDTGRLKHIYVREGLRGRGVAERLVQCCLARAGTRWRRIRLNTDSLVAARLYARYGFVPVEGEKRATHALVIAP